MQNCFNDGPCFMKAAETSNPTTYISSICRASRFLCMGTVDQRNLRVIGNIEKLFEADGPWIRINKELQDFPSFLNNFFV